MKFKKMTGLALLLAMTVMSTGAVYADVNVNSEDEAALSAYSTVNYDVIGGYLQFDDETGEVIKGTNGITIMEIPSRINDIAVTSIGEGKTWYSWGTAERTYDFRLVDGYADGVGTERCDDSYQRSGGFYGCTNLTSLTLNNGLMTIKPYAFKNCTSLKQVKFGGTLRSIGDEAFNNNIALASLDFPESLQAIGSSAFYGCSGLNSVKFSEGLVSVGNGSFEGCKNLKSVTFPESLITVGSSGFKGCNNITEINFNKTLTAIEDNTFENCISLEKVDIPSNITRLGIGSFKNTGLKEITLNEGLNTIDNEAFASCIALKKITIPKSVGSIGTDVFTNSALNTVYCYKNSVADNAKLYPEGTKIYYLDAENPSLVTEILSGDVDGDGKITANDSALVLQKALVSTFKMNVDGLFEVAAK